MINDSTFKVGRHKGTSPCSKSGGQVPFFRGLVTGTSPLVCGDVYSSSMVCTKTWKTSHDTAPLSIFTQLNMETSLFQAPSSKEHSEQMAQQGSRDQGSVFCATGNAGLTVPFYANEDTGHVIVDGSFCLKISPQEWN